MDKKNETLINVIENNGTCYVKDWTSQDLPFKHMDFVFPLSTDQLQNLSCEGSRDYQFMHKEATEMVELFNKGKIFDKKSKLIMGLNLSPVFHVEDLKKIQRIVDEREYFGVKIPEGISIILSLQNGDLIPENNKVVEGGAISFAILEDSKKLMMEYLRSQEELAD